MSGFCPFCRSIRLHVEGRISAEDAARQERTARDILLRLGTQPGVILADEVGMGKTFVALAVAVSVALEKRGRRPVVVMVPPSLREKWPADFELFRERCLPARLRDKVKPGRADRAVEFLKLLDDPPSRRRSVIFLTHGAMSQGLRGRAAKWVQLAFIYQALKGRWGSRRLRKSLSRCLGLLLQMGWAQRHGKGMWLDLLGTPPPEWLDVLHHWEIDPEADNDPTTDDDPVPRAVWKQLPDLDTDRLYDALRSLPRRTSASFEDRVVGRRDRVLQEMDVLWDDCLRGLRLRVPLLVLDEAHHLKNRETRLASLFQVPEAQEDAEELTRGPLEGAFDRMLFLTATPFQLGHNELCSVLDRFKAVNWRRKGAPKRTRDGFSNQLASLRAALDAAQESAVSLDTTWGLLRPVDVSVEGRPFEDIEAWWRRAAEVSDGLTPAALQVLRCYRRARERLSAAEALLKPWVIRHLKPRQLPAPHVGPRRRRLTGRAIADGPVDEEGGGILVDGDAVLPFLLAARATAYAPNARPVFAEGLASSYEAFLHTRSMHLRGDDYATDEDDVDIDLDEDAHGADAVGWYLKRLDALVPRGDADASAAHPKVSATVRRALDIWRSGEKVVVFCHYIMTGRTLRQRIGEAIDAEIRHEGAEKLGCRKGAVRAELERFSRRFFDQDSPIRRACDDETNAILSQFPDLRGHRERLVEIVRRNVRTPTFLVRFFPLGRRRLDAGAMRAALETRDLSGMTLREVLHDFFEFLVMRCGREDRERYVEALEDVQTGSHHGVDVTKTFAPDEMQGTSSDVLLPNVRLVNGATRHDTRQRLMLTFNTPFYPEVLIASSVMAEGVDLHLCCRHVIHHDLCWNPSTLEQRTGRIDRIGAKVERCGQPIHVYLPYVAETQDEKMYRVVMDRERWFTVVMGEPYKADARTTEKLANRIPFPESAASALAFRLEVVPTAESGQA